MTSRSKILFALLHGAAAQARSVARDRFEKTHAREREEADTVRDRAMAALEAKLGRSLDDIEQQTKTPPPPPKATKTPPPPPMGAKTPPPPPLGAQPPLPPSPPLSPPASGPTAPLEGTPGAAPAAEDSEGHALLLLQAMVRAAQADNRLESDEKDAIFARLEEADLSDKDRWFIEDEMRRKRPLEEWTEQIPLSLAEEVYMVSLSVMDTPNIAERRYLQQLAQALYLAPDTVRTLTDRFNGKTAS